MTFVKYMHIERYEENNPEIDGILNGLVYVFPKLDGSNHCIWFDNDKKTIRCASRNQIITKDYDATKFINTYYIPNQHKIDNMILENQNLVFYGEFMRPHVVKDYDDDVWDEWYIFDVYDRENNQWMDYETYASLINKYGLRVVTPMDKYNDPPIDLIHECVENNHYLISNGNIGEGVVIKNYNFVNKYGRTTWAKMVRNDYKIKAKQTPKERGEAPPSVEDIIVDNNLSREFIEKEYYKFIENAGAWNDRMIPDFIAYVWHEWWVDYSFDIIANSKDIINPKELRKRVANTTVKTIFKIRK